MWTFKRWFAGIALASVVQGAVVTVCATGCVESSLQVALNSTAHCGDVIEIKSSEVQSGNFTITDRGCTGATPITVTSDRRLWLPPAGGRVTPAHLGNMAVLSTPNSEPALGAVLSSGVPARGWVFQGVAFRSDSPGATYALVALNNYNASSVAELPSEIVFDQTYFYRPLPNEYAKPVQNLIRADGVAVTIRNSFFGDGFWHGLETHGIHVLTSPGPVVIENNFITASGIPIFSGGSAPSYPTYLENGVTARYNYTWRPWKWNFDPSQPFAADYAANAQAQGPFIGSPLTITDISNSGVVTTLGAPYFGEPGSGSGYMFTISGVTGCVGANGANWRFQVVSDNSFQLLNWGACGAGYTGGGSAVASGLFPCMKNHGEFKFGSNILWEFNVAENSWRKSSCGAQWNGFTGTLRTESDASVTHPSMGNISFTDADDLTWDGAYRIGGTDASNLATADMGICVSLPVTGTECHAIESYSGATLHTATPFSATTGGGKPWWMIYAGSSKLTNLTLRNNVFRNTDASMSTLALSPSNGVGTSGTGLNHTITNNLWDVEHPYVDGYFGFLIGAGEADYVNHPANFRWEHNTIFGASPRQQAWVFVGGADCVTCSTSNTPKFDASSISNNLFGPSNASVPFGGDSQATICGTMGAYFSNSTFQNNLVPGALLGTDCSGFNGNDGTGNSVSTWSDPYSGLSGKGIFKPVSGSAMQGAKDGDVIGVKQDNLPVITGLKTTVGTHSALLEFDVAPAIRDVMNTQACALEVSADRNLISGLNTYGVIPALNPLFFKQGDSSAGGNTALARVVQSGAHVYWPIGKDATVIDDSGVSRDLGLTAGALYYGRLMCHGDTKWFSFTTASASALPTASSPKLTIRANAGTATGVRVRWGSTPVLTGETEVGVGTDGSFEAGVPLTADEAVYYRLEFLSGTAVSYVGPLEVALGG